MDNPSFRPSRLLFVSCSLLFMCLALAAEAQDLRLGQPAAPPAPVPVRDVSDRENAVVRFYDQAAATLRLAGHDLDLTLDDVRTLAPASFASHRVHEVLSLGEGDCLRVEPQTRTDVLQGLENGAEQVLDRFMTFGLSWHGDCLQAMGSPETQEMLEEVGRRTLAELLAGAASDDERLVSIEAATTYRVTVRLGERTLSYRAVALWQPVQSSSEFVLVDNVFLQIDQAVQPQLPVRSLEAMRAPVALPEAWRMDAGGTVERSTTPCKITSKDHLSSSFKNGKEEHSGDGDHQSSADVTFACSCDSDCTSNCTPRFTFTNCADFTPRDLTRKHVAASSVDTKNGVFPNATGTAGAQCAAGFGCVFRSCFVTALSCSVSVGVTISDFKVSFAPNNATWSYNSGFELQNGCDRCAFEQSCLGAGSDSLCGTTTDPQPIGDGGQTQASPIVLDLALNGFTFSGPDATVEFDIDADGLLDHITWIDPESDDVFLVLDRNGNGAVDDGRELFGVVTDQPPSEDPNGFLALAVFDQAAEGGNEDGVISAADEIFTDLLVWKDLDGDGRSEPPELTPLADTGVLEIQLSYITSGRRDRFGNTLRWTSFMELLGHPGRHAVADVIFVRVAGG